MTAIIVSSRAPVWGASLPHMLKSVFLQFQVVPPCGGHREGGLPNSFRAVVSSRAPVWGASQFSCCAVPGAFSFKSCPRVGGILRKYFSNSFLQKFQVVPPCGGHRRQCLTMAKNNQFQVVPPCGGHLRSAAVNFASNMFQVVPPCGGHRA